MEQTDGKRRQFASENIELQLIFNEGGNSWIQPVVELQYFSWHRFLLKLNCDFEAFFATHKEIKEDRFNLVGAKPLIISVFEIP